MWRRHGNISFGDMVCDQVLHMKNQIDIGLQVADQYMERRLLMAAG